MRFQSRPFFVGRNDFAHAQEFPILCSLRIFCTHSKSRVWDGSIFLARSSLHVCLFTKEERVLSLILPRTYLLHKTFFFKGGIVCQIHRNRQYRIVAETRKEMLLNTMQAFGP